MSVRTSLLRVRIGRIANRERRGGGREMKWEERENGEKKRKGEMKRLDEQRKNEKREGKN